MVFFILLKENKEAKENKEFSFYSFAFLLSFNKKY